MRYAIEHDMIDMAYMQEKVKMSQRNELLKCHKNKIWQGKDGRWYTRFTDELGNRLLRSRKTRAELEDLICTLEKKKMDNPTVEECFELWIQRKISFHEIQEGSAARYQTDFKRFFSKTSFAKKKISDITEDDLEEFVKRSIVKGNLTAKSFSGLRIILKGIFQLAKKREWTHISITNFLGDLEISHNSFRKVKHEKEDEVFSEEEIPKLAEYLKNHPDMLNLGILLTLETGVRVGELLALKRSDLKGDVLQIRRHEHRHFDENGKVIYTVKEFAKTDAGVRDIILSKTGMETMKKLLEINDKYEYIFTSPLAVRYRASTINRRLDSVLEKLHMRHRSMHKLRKSYCTMLLNAGCDDTIVMSQMGHASVETSRRYYYYCNRSEEYQKEKIEEAVRF